MQKSDKKNLKRESFILHDMVLTKDDIEKFSGEWILLFEDKIIDHSYNLEDILKTAENYPEDEVIIAKAISPMQKFLDR